MIWNDTSKELATKLNTNFVTGLTQETAAQLLIETGPNQLPIAKKKAIWKMVLAHFIEPFVLVLIALAIIASIIGQWQEAVVVLLIVFVDATLGTYQEVKAAASLDSLKKLVSSQAVVIRDGNKYDIDAKELVIGDLVYLEAGMFVPADLRIIQSYNLHTNESLLTGEPTLIGKTTDALPAEKLAISERTNLAFMSTTIATGSGLGLVYATAKSSEIGKITKLLQEEKQAKSPLTKQMAFLIRIISLFALSLGLVMFLLQFFLIKTSAADALIFAIALAIAVIPEGLQVIVTVALSLGSSRMAKKHAIVKHLPAVETLGQVDIICSDKTGTLTQNKMTVKKYYLTTIKGSNDFKRKTKQEQLFLDCLVLCNNSSINENKTIGDPTEAALINWSETLSFSTKLINDNNLRIHEIPFDSDRKLMSTINEYGKERYAFVKGAVDNMINICSHVLINNERMVLTPQIKQQIILNMEKMSNAALRVLGASYKVVNNKKDYNISEIENNLTFLGLVGMIDPPREEVTGALVKTKRAGIETIMITGDHLNTAVAIGQELGLIENKMQAISGSVIDDIPEESFNANINKYRVFARVSPEHKVKIVKALQSHDKVISMTGDGVNDAPSLKAANIGIAMGITGTDVAKEASQIVLTDDNFATIVDAIEEGRNIYSKIKRIVCFILITNMAQVLSIIIGAIFQWNELLQPIQILWINLIVESVIAIPMSMGPNNPELMLKKPIKRNDRIISGSWGFIGVVSVILSALLLLTFRFLPQILNENISENESFVFVFVIMTNAPIFYAFSFVSGTNTSVFNKITWRNKYIWMAAIVAFAINTFIIFTPFVKDAFSISNEFQVTDWLICIGLSTIPMWLLEIYKGMRIIIKKFIKMKKQNEIKI